MVIVTSSCSGVTLPSSSTPGRRSGPAVDASSFPRLMSWHEKEFISKLIVGTQPPSPLAFATSMIAMFGKLMVRSRKRRLRASNGTLSSQP